MAVSPLVFLDISGMPLATGIGLVDSMLDPTGCGPIVIALAAMSWTISGAIVGEFFGCVCTAYTQGGNADQSRQTGSTVE